jgi:two-component system, NtrC family, nitrogen regulation response regulator NtrX
MREAILAPVLVIDDDEQVRRVVVELLGARGQLGLAAASVRDGLRLFTERRPAAVILDMKLPDGMGLDVLRELQRQSPGTPVVVISGYGSVHEAVLAMQAGATDFIEKPVSRERLFEVLDRVLQPALPVRETDPDAVADGSRFGMLGRSEAMRRVYQLVEMAAPTKCRIFVSGESGTGKELVARAIHALSPRRERPFVELNCAAIPQELIESELFGHVKGAFTGAFGDRKGRFEAAHEGTLFLDEIGDMSLATQAKLLRVLQENVVSPVGSIETRPVDVRVVSATGKDLIAEIARGTFREDLYHRINVLSIALPPLRARGVDVADLAQHFLRLACLENGRPAKRLQQRALDLLCQLPWPGNVRELRNLMERLAILAPSDDVGREEVLSALQMRDVRSEPGGALPLRQARARFEREYILERLTANGGHLGRTARDLGIERTNLYRKMRQLGIRAHETLQS